MKLYTEEQLRSLLDKMDVIYSLEDLTPIELPSNEEIESGMNQRLFLSDKNANFNSGAKAGFKLGAKWMRDKLTNTKEK